MWAGHARYSALGLVTAAHGRAMCSEYCEFVDESRKDVQGLAQIRVVPPAEKGTSKVVPLVKACADRMG